MRGFELIPPAHRQCFVAQVPWPCRSRPAQAGPSQRAATPRRRPDAASASPGLAHLHGPRTTAKGWTSLSIRSGLGARAGRRLIPCLNRNAAASAVNRGSARATVHGQRFNGAGQAERQRGRSNRHGGRSVRLRSPNHSAPNANFSVWQKCRRSVSIRTLSTSVAAMVRSSGPSASPGKAHENTDPAGEQRVSGYLAL